MMCADISKIVLCAGFAVLSLFPACVSASELDAQIGEIQALLRDISGDRERSGGRNLPDHLQGHPVDLHRIILDASQLVEIDPAVLVTLIKIESGFDPSALSSAGAQGLTQLMPATAAELGVRDVWNPRDNVKGGARWLARLLQEHDGNLLAALASYNAGSSVMRRAWNQWPSETRNYLEKFVRLYPMVAEDWKKHSPHYIYIRS